MAKCDACQLYLWRCLGTLTIAICALLLYTHYQNYNEVFEIDGSMISGRAEKLTQEECENMCISKECIETANRLLEHVDDSVDPCTNFHSFACGKWIKQFSGEDNYRTTDEMEDNIKLVLKGIIKSIKDPPTTDAGKLKTLYTTCLNYNASEVNAVPSMVQFLKLLGIGEWPRLSSDFEFFNPSFEEATAILMSYYEPNFFQIFPTKIENERSNGSSASIYSVKPLPDPTRVPNNNIEESVKKVLKYFEIVGADSDAFWNEFDSLVQQLQQIYEKSQNKCEDIYDNCTADVINIKCEITDEEISDEMKFVCNVVKHVALFNKFESEILVSQVKVSNPDYILDLHQLLLNTSHRALANYFAINLFLNHLDHLNLYFSTISEESYQKATSARWTECINWLMTTFTFNVAQLYQPKHLPTEALSDIKRILGKLVNLSSETTLKQEWIEDTTKSQLNRKLLSINNSLESYASQLKDLKLLLLEKFTVTEDSHFLNVMEQQKNIFISEPLYYDSDLSFPPNIFTIGAYPGIDIFFGLLVTPAYKHGNPEFLNFASLGQVIGHELGHEIDLYFDAGIFQRKDEINIVDDHSKGIFHQKKKCLADQMSNLILQKIQKNVNGNFTALESLPDLISRQFLDKVLKEMDNNNELIQLPGLPYTTKQLFYIQSAQLYCNVESKEAEELLHKYDRHLVSYIRVNGILRNSKQFAETFHCAEGSFMNPEEKCSFFD